LKTSSLYYAPPCPVGCVSLATVVRGNAFLIHGSGAPERLDIPVYARAGSGDRLIRVAGGRAIEESKEISSAESSALNDSFFDEALTLKSTSGEKYAVRTYDEDWQSRSRPHNLKLIVA
jgi:hypothetical protein